MMLARQYEPFHPALFRSRDDLVGIVLTHAHEDHLGAVPDLWPRLRAPVYATPFAASVLRRKLIEEEREKASKQG